MLIGATYLETDVLGDQVLVERNAGSSASLTVHVTSVQEIVVSSLESKLVRGLLVVLAGLVDKSVHLVVEQGILEAVELASAERLVLEGLLDPLLVGVEPENGVVGNILDEVGVGDTITGISKSDTGGVGTVLLDDVVKGHEVAGRLGHLLAVELQVAVGTDGLGPVLAGEEGDVVVQPEGQVVGDEILAGDTDVEGIEVLELAAHRVESLLGDAGLGDQVVGQLGAAEDVVPDLVNHLLSANVALTLLATEEVLVQPVSDSVVGHVDGRVRKRLDKEVVVPRKLGAETVGTGASPLLEPADDALEGVLGVGVVGVDALAVLVLDVVVENGAPRVLTVVNVPLVHEGNGALITGAGDDLVLGLRVGESITGIDELLADLGLGSLNLLALEVTVVHDTLVEALLVGELLGLEELLGVLGGVDLELLDEVRGKEVRGRGLDDRDDLLVNPLLLDAVEFGLLGELSHHGAIIGRVRGNGGDDTGTLGGEDGVHWEDVDLLVDGEGSIDEGTDKLGTDDISSLLNDALLLEDALVGHVLGSTLGDDKVLVLRGLVNAILEGRADEAADLAVHGLGTEGGGAKVDVGALGELALESLGSLGSPLLDLELESSVLLGKDTLTLAAVVVHAGLAILDGVDGVALAELDLVELLETVHLPADKGIVVGVGVGGDELTAPVDTGTEVGEILLALGREELEPVLGVGELVNLLDGDTERLEDLELVLGATGLCDSLALLGVELGDVLLGLGRSSRGGRGSVLNNLLLLVALELLAKHLNLLDQLVGRGLDGQTGAVVALGEEGALALHAGEAGVVLDLGEAEGVAGVEAAVHVGVGDGAEELGVLFAQLIGGDGVEGVLLGGGGIDLEDALVLPFLLVLLLDLDEGVSLFGALELLGLGGGDGEVGDALGDG